MTDHSHAPAHASDLGTRLMAMSAGRRLLWAGAGVVVLWLAVWWAMSFEAKAAPASQSMAVTGSVR